MIDYINISNPVLDYFARVIICSGILWIISLMTARYINFRAARALIIGSALISIIMPLWRIGVFPAAEQFIPNGSVTIENLEPQIITNAVETSGQNWFTLERILMLAYGGVMLLLIARMTAGLIGITRYRRNTITTCHENIEVKINPIIETPFSFGHTIYIGDMESCVEREMILLHESVHVRERHSREVLAMEILTVIMWINPFFHLLKKLLREVHEYQADSVVVGAGNDVEKYKLLIFSQLTGQIPELAGALTNSLTKKRLIMITQKFRGNRLRALLLLPALALCAALVSFTTKEAPTQTTIQTQTLLENPTPDKTPIADTLSATIRKRGENSTTDEGKTNKTIIIDGKQATTKQLNELNPSSIKSVVVHNNSIVVTTHDTVIKVSAKVQDKPVLSAEVMPTFMGEPATTAFSKWCTQNMKFPTSAKKDLKSARIVVSLVINKQGKIESQEIDIQRLDFRLENTTAVIIEINESILKVLKSAPDKWTPGTINGEPVNVKISVPILLQNK